MKSIKWLIGVVIASAFSLSAFAATLNPIQLLNPAGSSAGNAIVSTGPTTAPAWANVSISTLTGVLPIANGGTGQTSAAAALTALGGLSTTTAASTYATIANLALKAPLASPTFTGTVNAAAMTASGLITPASAIGIKGTATSDSAPAGSIGEYAVYGGSSSLTSGTAATCASTTTPLTAGDWEVDGQIQFIPASGTTTSGLVAGVSTSPTAFINTPGTSVTNASVSNSAVPATQQSILVAPRTRITIAASTTIYMVGQATFAVSTMTCNGVIRARRVR